MAIVVTLMAGIFPLLLRLDRVVSDMECRDRDVGAPAERGAYRGQVLAANSFRLRR